MGNFKAQILGIILVLGIFTMLNGLAKDTFSGALTAAHNKVSDEISNALPEIQGG